MPGYIQTIHTSYIYIKGFIEFPQQYTWSVPSAGTRSWNIPKNVQHTSSQMESGVAATSQGYHFLISPTLSSVWMAPLLMGPSKQNTSPCKSKTMVRAHLFSGVTWKLHSRMDSVFNVITCFTVISQKLACLLSRHTLCQLWLCSCLQWNLKQQKSCTCKQVQTSSWSCTGTALLAGFLVTASNGRWKSVERDLMEKLNLYVWSYVHFFSLNPPVVFTRLLHTPLVLTV